MSPSKQIPDHRIQEDLENPRVDLSPEENYSYAANQITLIHNKKGGDLSHMSSAHSNPASGRQKLYNADYKAKS
jgi:hypothetical protein